MREPLTVAVAQPTCRAKDVAANAVAHAGAIARAQARLVVFPELSVTGYELDAQLLDPTDDRLAPIVEACGATGSVALVGAPVGVDGGGAHIAMLLVDGSGARVVYRKCWLGGDEPRRFSPGPGPVVLDVGGWRVGLGICKDTGTAQHLSDIAALDLDLYVAGLVHLPEELEEQDRRGVAITRATGAPVAFASCAGPTGGGFDRTAGRSTIWSPSGTLVARASRDPGDVVCATIA